MSVEARGILRSVQEEVGVRVKAAMMGYAVLAVVLGMLSWHTDPLAGRIAVYGISALCGLHAAYMVWRYGVECRKAGGNLRRFKWGMIYVATIWVVVFPLRLGWVSGAAVELWWRGEGWRRHIGSLDGHSVRYSRSGDYPTRAWNARGGRGVMVLKREGILNTFEGYVMLGVGVDWSSFAEAADCRFAWAIPVGGRVWVVAGRGYW